MASPGNRHCASCIGTLSFPVGCQRRRQRRIVYDFLFTSPRKPSKRAIRSNDYHCPCSIRPSNGAWTMVIVALYIARSLGFRNRHRPIDVFWPPCSAGLPNRPSRPWHMGPAPFRGPAAMNQNIDLIRKENYNHAFSHWSRKTEKCTKSNKQKLYFHYSTN